MTLREMECSKCAHWTKKGKPHRARLCRHPNHLHNSAEDKEAGRECWEYTGPRCFCEDFHLVYEESEEALIDHLVSLHQPGTPMCYVSKYCKRNEDDSDGQ